MAFDLQSRQRLLNIQHIFKLESHTWTQEQMLESPFTAVVTLCAVYRKAKAWGSEEVQVWGSSPITH